MKLKLLVAALLITLLAACGAESRTPVPLPSTSGPKMVISQDLMDFGRVPFDKMLDAVFTVKNEGDAPLTITVPKVVTALEGC